jgi:hypothetical protein
MTLSTQEFLAHYGVKGMKWGVRKAPDRSRSASNWKARKDKERAAKLEKASSSKRNAAKKMSDDELKAAVQRLQLEKQYVELSQQPQQLTRGQKFAKDLGDIAVEVAKTQIKNTANAVLKKELEKRLGIKTEPKKKKVKKEKT